MTTTTAAGPARPTQAPRTVTTNVLRDIWPPLAVFGVAIGIWYLISYGLLDADRRFLMPPPHQVLIEGFLDDAGAPGDHAGPAAAPRSSR